MTTDLNLTNANGYVFTGLLCSFGFFFIERRFGSTSHDFSTIILRGPIWCVAWPLLVASLMWTWWSDDERPSTD